MILHTIGHSNLSLPDFLRVLREHDISYVVDVRSSPSSARFPHFNRPDVASSLEKTGIEYFYMGDKLGGKPNRSEPYKWKQGKIDPRLVSNLSRTTAWTAGIEILSSLVQKKELGSQIGCLLCSEGDANNCHRLLIAFEVADNVSGLTVNHILPRTKRAAQTHFQKTML